MPRICAFDVNETLLDLRALDPHFEHAFGDAAVRQAWFAQLLRILIWHTRFRLDCPHAQVVLL